MIFKIIKKSNSNVPHNHHQIENHHIPPPLNFITGESSSTSRSAQAPFIYNPNPNASSAQQANMQSQNESIWHQQSHVQPQNPHSSNYYQIHVSANNSQAADANSDTPVFSMGNNSQVSYESSTYPHLQVPSILSLPIPPHDNMLALNLRRGIRLNGHPIEVII